MTLMLDQNIQQNIYNAIGTTEYYAPNIVAYDNLGFIFKVVSNIDPNKYVEIRVDV